MPHEFLKYRFTYPFILTALLYAVIFLYYYSIGDWLSNMLIGTLLLFFITASYFVNRKNTFFYQLGIIASIGEILISLVAFFYLQRFTLDGRLTGVWIIPRIILIAIILKQLKPFLKGVRVEKEIMYNEDIIDR